MPDPIDPGFALTNPTENDVYIGVVRILPNTTIVVTRLSAEIRRAIALGLLTATPYGGTTNLDPLALFMQTAEYHAGPTSPDPLLKKVWFDTVRLKLFAYYDGTWYSTSGETEQETDLDLVATRYRRQRLLLQEATR